EDIPLRPMHLIAFAAVIMVGTKQNMFPILKNFIDNRAMSIGFAALALICMSTFFFHASIGEYLFIHMVERLGIILFLLTGIFHFFYVMYNFGVLIRARVNFYYLSMMPKRLLYFFVVIATVLVGFAFEASDQNKTRRLFSSVMYNRLADHELLLGNNLDALTWYLASTAVANGTPKGNYNLAMLALTNDDKVRAREHFDKASQFIPFPYAALNRANMELDAGSIVNAKAALRKIQKKTENAYVSNNLAHVFLRFDEPDSAVIELKKALKMEPERSALYSNLGRLYMENHRPDWARKFFAEGLKVEDVRAAIVTNALYYNLRYAGDLDISDDLLNHPKVDGQRTTAFNFALDRYKRRDFAGASTLLDSMLAVDETPDALLLDGMIRFETGNVEEAVSRMAYMDAHYQGYRRYTNHYLGVGFFQAGVPEMAAAFFNKSAAHGRTADIMNEARMEIDRGNQEYAFQRMNAARTADSTLFDEVSREIAMMQLARGEYFMASLGFDLGTLSRDEHIRTGLYAGAIGNQPAALEAFRKVITMDSSMAEPYLEMGRISFKMGDSLALENLLPGLALAPKDVNMRVEVARARNWLGKRQEAEEMLTALKADAAENWEVKLLEADMAMSVQDSGKALEIYKALYAVQPLDQRAVLGMSRILRGQRQDFEGQNLMYDVLEINPRNPDFWYEMAQFERLLNREEACGGAAYEAMMLATTPENAAAIEAEFSAEIALFIEANPDLVQ
ncbi:MAG: hypothetical protein AAF570_01955, partial [Bacteroidota bacterium]